MSKRIKNIILICVLVAVIAAGSVVLAEFTRSSRAKRVAISAGGSGMMFSSNYLLPVPGVSEAADKNKDYIYASDTESDAEFTVTVCNYPQGELTKYYERNISYVLQAEIVGAGGVSLASGTVLPSGYQVVITVNDGSQNPQSVTLSSSTVSGTFSSSTLASGAANSDSYTVEISGAAVAYNEEHAAADRLYLKLTAALASTYPGLTSLDCVFDAAVASAVERQTWRGYFNEERALAPENTEAPLPGELDGFNYVIEGNGEGTVRLSWRSDMLVLSDYFRLVSLSSQHPSVNNSSEQNWQYIEFSVDSDSVSRYDLHFYKNSTNAADYSAWENGVLDYVNFEFTLSSQE